MTRPLSQPAKSRQPPGAVQYLPQRLLCPDGRLRMVNVAHREQSGGYAPAFDVCGRVPALAPSYQGFRDVAGFCAGNRFYPRKEE